MAPPTSVKGAGSAAGDRVRIENDDHVADFGAILSKCLDSGDHADVYLRCSKEVFVKDTKDGGKDAKSGATTTAKTPTITPAPKAKEPEPKIEKFQVIRCHRAVLASISDFFAKLLDGHAVEEEVHVSLPELEPEILKLVVEFAYKGETKIPRKDAESVCEAAQRLKVKFLKDTFVKINEKDFQAIKDGKKTLKSIQQQNAATAAATAAAPAAKSLIAKKDTGDKKLVNDGKKPNATAATKKTKETTKESDGPPTDLEADGKQLIVRPPPGVKPPTAIVKPPAVVTQATTRGGRGGGRGGRGGGRGGKTTNKADAKDTKKTNAGNGNFMILKPATTQGPLSPKGTVIPTTSTGQPPIIPMTAQQVQRLIMTKTSGGPPVVSLPNAPAPAISLAGLQPLSMAGGRPVVPSMPPKVKKLLIPPMVRGGAMPTAVTVAGGKAPTGATVIRPAGAPGGASSVPLLNLNAFQVETIKQPDGAMIQVIRQPNSNIMKQLNSLQPVAPGSAAGTVKTSGPAVSLPTTPAAITSGTVTNASSKPPKDVLAKAMESISAAGPAGAGNKIVLTTSAPAGAIRPMALLPAGFKLASSSQQPFPAGIRITSPIRTFSSIPGSGGPTQMVLAQGGKSFVQLPNQPVLLQSLPGGKIAGKGGKGVVPTKVVTLGQQPQAGMALLKTVSPGMGGAIPTSLLSSLSPTRVAIPAGSPTAAATVIATNAPVAPGSKLSVSQPKPGIPSTVPDDFLEGGDNESSSDDGGKAKGGKKRGNNKTNNSKKPATNAAKSKKQKTSDEKNAPTKSTSQTEVVAATPAVVTAAALATATPAATADPQPPPVTPATSVVAPAAGNDGEITRSSGRQRKVNKKYLESATVNNKKAESNSDENNSQSEKAVKKQPAAKTEEKAGTKRKAQSKTATSKDDEPPPAKKVAPAKKAETKKAAATAASATAPPPATPANIKRTAAATAAKKANAKAAASSTTSSSTAPDESFPNVFISAAESAKKRRAAKEEQKAAAAAAAEKKASAAAAAAAKRKRKR